MVLYLKHNESRSDFISHYKIYIMIIKTIKSYSDAELIQLIQNRSKEGFDALYNKYCSLLYGLTVYSTQLQIYAEEIIELTFLKIWRSIDNFNYTDEKFVHYNIKILLEVIKDYLNSKEINYIILHDKTKFKFELSHNYKII